MKNTELESQSVHHETQENGPQFPEQLSEKTRELLWRLMRFRMGTRAAGDIPTAYRYYLGRGREPVFEKYEDAVKECGPLQVMERNEQSMVDAQRMEQFLMDRFSPDLLKRALVERLIVDATTDVIHMPHNNDYKLPNGDYFVPPALTEQIFTSLTPEHQEKFSDLVARAYSLSIWHETSPELRGLYFYAPIILYHNDYDDVSSGLRDGKDPSSLAQDYLQDIPQEDREFVYLASMMGHEIGHHIYTFIIRKDQEMEEAWKAVIDRTGIISSYAGWYKKDPKYYEENFCEAVRIYIVSPDNLPREAADFLRKVFPEIQSLLMAEGEKCDGDQEGGLQLVLTFADLELAPGYIPGKDGNPTVKQITEALRRELDLGPDFPIGIGQRIT
jgi:hypothetical protein